MFPSLRLFFFFSYLDVCNPSIWNEAEDETIHISVRGVADFIRSHDLHKYKTI